MILTLTGVKLKRKKSVFLTLPSPWKENSKWREIEKSRRRKIHLNVHTVAKRKEKSLCFKILTTHICAEKPGGWTDFHSAAAGLPAKTRGAFHKSTSILSHTS